MCAWANYANVNTVPSLLALADAMSAASQLRAQVWQHIAIKDISSKIDIARTMNEAQAKVIAALDKYEKEDMSNDRDKELLDADPSAVIENGILRENIIGLVKSDKAEEAQILISLV
jgi:hypothetical protein